jgi:beta-N-acetylhexosaminidase
MDDMAGIAEALPSMSEATAARLQRALEGVSVPEAADRRALLAKRDALLALRAA